MPRPVPGPMPPGGHPAYVLSAVPPQQHAGGMILHPSHPALPSIYPPPPPPGGCFPLLHMVHYRMIPSPADQPQEPDQFAFTFPVAYWPHRNFPVEISGSQIDQQNPDSGREQADHRNFGNLAHSHPHLIPYVRIPPHMPHHIFKQHACPPVSNLRLEIISRFPLPNSNFKY